MEQKNNVKGKAQKFWNITNISEDEAEITMYGEIRTSHPVDWWTGEKLPGCFITPEGFLEELSTVKGKSKITIRLNSGGGDLATGMAIYTQLKDLKAEKTVIIDALAGSAASLIACAGDKVKCAASGQIMIHEPLVSLSGYYTKEILEKYDAMLESNSVAAAEVYVNKTGMDIKEIRKMMKKETWMTGKQAKDYGFVDELMFENVAIEMSADKTKLFSNGLVMSLEGFRNIPTNIPIKSNQPSITLDDNINKKSEGGVRLFTKVEELEKEYPDLVNQIKENAKKEGEKQGIAAEKARFKAIEEIQAMVPADLLNDAKFGENQCTAQELAFKAIQAQSEKGSNFMKSLKADSDASGADTVLTTPNAGNEITDNLKAKSDEDAIAMIVGRKTGGKENE